MRTTLDIKMSNSQEHALEYAICNLTHQYVTRMNNAGDGDGKYQVRECEVLPTDYKTVILQMSFDNGLPGTYGFNHPTRLQLFIGSKGGYRAYKNCGKGLVTGRRALIYCTYY